MAVEGPSRSSTLTLRKPYMERNGESEDASLRMSLTSGAVSDDHCHLPPLPSGAGKRKQPELNSTGRFKAVSQLVLAMNRFKASLNPTYTFGKRPESSNSGSGWVRDTPERNTQEATSNPSSQRTPPTVDQVDATRQVYRTRGHKTNYIMRPLPPTDQEDALDRRNSDGI